MIMEIVNYFVVVYVWLGAKKRGHSLFHIPFYWPCVCVCACACACVAWLLHKVAIKSKVYETVYVK